MLVDRMYFSLAEEGLLGGGGPVAVVYPRADCGLSCRFCALVEEAEPKEISAAELAEWAIAGGASALEWCAPPPAGEAADVFSILSGRGVPCILKGTGAEEPDFLREGLDRFFAVYVPDIKFGQPLLAGALCGMEEYPARCEAALAAAEALWPKNELRGGRLVRGVLGRHLLLPGLLCNAAEAMELFAPHAIPCGWPLHIMGQYAPLRGAIPGYPSLGRLATQEEYRQAVQLAGAMGLDVY